MINFLLCFALLITLLSSALPFKLALALGNETDRLALLALKDELLLGGSGIDISRNSISGSVPNNLGNLKNLRLLNIEVNQLGSGKEGDVEFFSSLRNCSMLSVLSMHMNNLGGVFPDSVANLSAQLYELRMGFNQITGSITQGISNLVNLYLMSLSENFLVGEIPSSIGKLQSLEGLWLYSNFLTGEIPSTIGNLTRLYALSLHTNNFTGGIPPTLQNCQNMRTLSFSDNKLSSPIPNQVFGAFPSLIILDLSYNSLTGALPSDFTTSKNLIELTINDNNFFGEIPMIQSLEIEVLKMQGNSFQGTIPQSFGSLRSLKFVDLSSNNLSGIIPPQLEKLPLLVSLNLSFNQLDGEVPKEGVFKNVSGFSFMGNRQLCGGISELGLPKCSNKEAKGKGKVLSTKIIIAMVISIFFAFLLAVTIVFLSWRRKSKRAFLPVALFESSGDRMRIKDAIIELHATKARLVLDWDL
ncbi:hypothetical protein COLO4_25622 [Corchorus olitorius]|uniref:Disease resistance R13L4/SHOC-2-like LRR domain-containing protein n=1 Tax=Corchorus olitorius TaxID=93759 RepID=A0A1R3I0Z1_9ROSI|nr:hypothetical protein COLO4_25622 [Corchorus olitorius]